MLELQINELQELQPIGFNYEALKAELAENLKRYQGLVFTEDTVIEAKTSRATLNKLAKAINDRKIELKNAYMSPYTAFETKIKELLSMIDAPVQEIDKQIKAFEETKRAEKRAKIKEVFSGFTQRYPVELDQIFEDSWLNASVSIKKVEEFIESKISRITSDITAIRDFKSEFEVQLEDLYFKTFDLSKILAEKTRLEAIKKTKEEATSKAAEQQEQSQSEPVSSNPEEVRMIDFRVWVTDSKLRLLKEFLLANQIRYGKPS